MAKTLQSAVQTLERDKAQLQGRVHSLEQRLMGTQASSEGGDAGAPPSGGRRAVGGGRWSCGHYCLLLLTPCVWCSPCRRRSTGAAEGGEGVRRGPSKTDRLTANRSAGVGLVRSYLRLLLPPSDQLPEQRHRGPAAEERGPEGQAEEAGAGRVQRQRRERRVSGGVGEVASTLSSRGQVKLAVDGENTESISQLTFFSVAPFIQ